MTAEELQEMVQSLREAGGDLAQVEVKCCKGGLTKRLWETLSAFANTADGGVIILGLDEEHGFQVVNLPDPAGLQSAMASLCDQMEPPLRPLIQIHTFEGKPVVVAEIPEIAHTEKPCYYRGAGLATGAFIRVADGDRRLTQYEIQVYLDGRGQPAYDQEPVSGKSLADLDSSLLDAFVSRLRARPDAPYRNWERKRLLQVFRVLVEHKGELAPTLAGYLCFAKYPQDLFPSLHLSVVRYPTARAGEVSARNERLLDNVKAEGPIIAMLQQGTNAILRNLQRRAVVQGLFRQDVWEYPLEALREALVNAFVHRDYSAQARGTPVQVRIFPDRLELENPGGLFGPVTIDRLGDPGLLATRNSYLVHMLEDLPDESGRVVCENRGTGIPTMLEALRAAGMEPPRFEDRRTTFRVSFSNASLLDENAISWLNGFAAHELSDAQRLALAYARREGRLAHADYRRLNPGLDSAEVTRQLADLVHRDLLRQHGVRRWTYYTVPVELPGETREPATEPAELAKLTSELTTQTGELTTQTGELTTQANEVDAVTQGAVLASTGLGKRASIEQVRAAVLGLCAGQARSPRELAEMLQRNRAGLQWRYLRLLVAEKLIERTASSPHDPHLRYRTTKLGHQWLAEHRALAESRQSDKEGEVHGTQS